MILQLRLPNTHLGYSKNDYKSRAHLCDEVLCHSEGRHVPVPRQLQVNGQAKNRTSHPPSEVLLKIANADQHNTLDFQRIQPRQESMVRSTGLGRIALAVLCLYA